MLIHHTRLLFVFDKEPASRAERQSEVLDTGRCELRKHWELRVAALALAAVLMAMCPACGKKTEKPVPMPGQAATEVKTDTTSAAYTQEKPYTADFFGPWNADMAKVHLPEITYEKTGSGLSVTVKIDSHPMDAETPHYIMWIRLEDGNGNVLGQKEFAATDPAPVATFELATAPAKLAAFERCNIHGIWMSEVEVK
jgi:desulfoferrodoxin-like iron-binding protein